MQALLAQAHWHAGVVFFLFLAAAMLPAAFMAGAVDRMPRPVERRATMREVLGTALTSRRFVVMSVAYFVCGLQLVFLTTHLPNYLAICGQDPMLSATALATIGGVNIFGSYTAGWLGGRFPKHILLGLLYLSRSVVIALYFMTPPTPTSTIVFAAAMGMLWLGVIPLVSGYVAELFGTRYMATILGLSFVIHQVGSVIGAWGGGLILDAFGSYDAAWKIGVMVGAAAGTAQILFGGPVLPGIGRRPVLRDGLAVDFRIDGIFLVRRTIQHTQDVLRGRDGHCLDRLDGHARHVRRRNDRVERQQRIVRRRRFLLEHIQSGTGNVAGLQRLI